MLAFQTLLTPWLDYCAHYHKSDSALAKPVTKVLLFILVLSAATLVAFSRLYLGVHSLDQVLYGALLGTWVALTWHFLIMDDLMAHLQALLSGKDKRFARMAIITSVAMLLTYIALICNVELRDEKTVVGKAEWAAKIEKECGVEALSTAFHNRSLIDIGPVAGGFGAYYGVLIHAKWLPGFTQHGRPVSEQRPILSMFGRLLVGIVICLPFLAMNLLVHGNSFDDVSGGRYLVLALDRFIPSLGAAICILGVTDIVCVKVLKFYAIGDTAA